MISRVAGSAQGRTAVTVQDSALITGIVAISKVAVRRLLPINGEAA